MGKGDIKTRRGKVFNHSYGVKRPREKKCKNKTKRDVEISNNGKNKKTKEAKVNEVKRQHYVPRTYLKHFSQERSNDFFINRLPIKDCKESNVSKTNIINVCVEKGLYTLPGNSVQERMFIENFYSDEIESHYNKIYNILTDSNKKTITPEERKLVISTVVTMLYRTTKWKNIHNDLMMRVFDQMYNLCEQTGKDYFIFEGEKISIAGKTLKEFHNAYKIENKPSQMLIQLDLAFKLIELRTLNDGIYVVRLEEEDQEFITSDNPVIYHKPGCQRTVPFDPKNILKLPLDNKHLLFLMPYANTQTSHIISRNMVKGNICFTEKLTSNYEQFCNAERFLLGKESALKAYLSLKEVSEKPMTDEEISKIKSFNDIAKTFEDLGLT